MILLMSFLILTFCHHGIKGELEDKRRGSTIREKLATSRTGLTVETILDNEWQPTCCILMQAQRIPLLFI